MTKEGDAALYSRLHPIKNPGIQRLLPSRIVFLFYVHFIVRRLKKNANTYFPPSSHCPPHGYHDRHFHFVDLHAHPTQRFFNPQVNPVNAVGRATGMMIMILSCHATLALPSQNTSRDTLLASIYSSAQALMIFSAHSTASKYNSWIGSSEVAKLRRHSSCCVQSACS